MKQYIRSYQMFFPGNYIWVKLLLYIIYPVFTIGAARFFLPLPGGAFICLVMAPFIMTIEIMFDYFFFGGIAAKDTGRLEYLKTSCRGMVSLKKGLIVDAVRRLGSMAVIELGIYVMIGNKIRKEDGVSIFQAAFFLFLSFLIVELALCLTRFFTDVWVSVLVYCLVEMLWMGIIMQIHWHAFMGTAKIFLILALVVAGAGVVWFNIKIIMKRAERSYYDV